MQMNETDCRNLLSDHINYFKWYYSCNWPLAQFLFKQIVDNALSIIFNNVYVCKLKKNTYFEFSDYVYLKNSNKP